MIKTKTLYECLKETNTNQLYQEILSTYEGWDNQEACAQATMNFFNQLLTLKPHRNTKKFIIVMVLRTSYDFGCEAFNQRYECSLVTFNKKNYKTYKPLYTSLLEKKIDTLNPDEIDDFFDKTSTFIFGDGTTWSFEFDKPENALGYFVPIRLINYYGLEKMMAQILFEMTFLGFDNDSITQEQDETINDITQTYDEALNNEKKLTPVTQDISFDDASFDLALDKSYMYNKINNIKIYNILVSSIK